MSAKPLTPEDFLKILLPKLEACEREQKQREIFEQHFPKHQEAQMDKHKLLNDAVNAKLMIDDTDNQDILDNHVSRVWNERTPNRSPGNLSPGTQFQRSRALPEHMVAVGLSKGMLNFSLFKVFNDLLNRFANFLDARQSRVN